MIKRIPLKYKLILGTSLAVFIPFLIAGTISYLQLSDSLIEHTREDVANIANNLAGLIEYDLQKEVKLANTIAVDPGIINSVKTGDYQYAQALLEAGSARIGNGLFVITILDKNGILRADPTFKQNIGLDLSDRKYFINAREGRTVIDGPMTPRGSATPGELIYALAAPIMDQGEFIGAIGLFFNTDFIMQILSENERGKTGTPFLINKEGMFLIHPNSEYVLKQNFIHLAGMEKIEDIVKSGEGGPALLRFENEEKIAGIAHVKSTDWVLVFTQSRAEAMSPVSEILTSIILSGVLFIGITIFIIAVVSEKVSDPVNKFLEVMWQVTQHSNEIIMQISPDRKIIFVNPAYEKFTGLKAEDVIGTDAHFNSVHSSAASVWEMLEVGTPWSGRVGYKKADGDVTMEVMAVPARSGRGAIQAYVVIGKDITKELMFEKRLGQSQKLEAIGTLAGGIAHDFNNILTGISGYAELGLLKKHSASQVEASFREILIASDRARDLTGQILAFSRKHDVELRPLSPAIILKEALKLLRAFIPPLVDIQENLNTNSVILADATQLHQVIMNIFTNAVHAIGENKGTIKVELEDIFVDEELVATHPNIKPGMSIIIRISDNGKGMEKAVLDHVFEPFFTTKPKGEGTGLGLSVVHGIVKSFNGVITVYSEVGNGTSFNIIIPSQEPDSVDLHQQEDRYIRGDERIVLIDDEENITESMEAILSHLGYIVTAFNNSEEALQAILNRPDDFDVIITDHSMAGLTGLELAQEMKEAGVNIPVILTSGYFSKNVEEEARNNGISSLIKKPINTFKLTEMIQRILKVDPDAS